MTTITCVTIIDPTVWKLLQKCFNRTAETPEFMANISENSIPEVTRHIGPICLVPSGSSMQVQEGEFIEPPQTHVKLPYRPGSLRQTVGQACRVH